NAIIVDDVINEDDLDLMTDNTRKALKQLWDAINPENYNECQIGLVFDVLIYLEALGLYDKNFDTFGTWDRRSFWCVRVKELIASVLPTIYLRAHCGGIGNVVNGDIVAWDKLSGRGCLLVDGSSYFNRHSNNLPARRFFVGYYGVASQIAGTSYSSFSKLMSSNNESWARLYAAIFPRQHTSLSNSMR
ncbi:MAG: hypothetical protein KF702_09475, partial [Gammaproteobacteria bacterium]|nr:hypothetical protein [Gammaproteobacteria bacterium]